MDVIPDEAANLVFREGEIAEVENEDGRVETIDDDRDEDDEEEEDEDECRVCRGPAEEG
jgi:hypothetical protein